MNESAGVEAATIPNALSFFGIGRAREISTPGFGMSNHNFLVRTDRGEFVVKLLAHQAPANIEIEIAIQGQLRAAGIGTPEYLRNADGQYLCRNAAVNAVVSRRIDGVTPRHMSVGLATDIGRHLALFHTSVRTVPHPNSTSLLSPEVALVTSDVARTLPDQPLPRGIIHGDLHDGNVLVDPLNRDRVIAILDFEEAGENLYLIDLAVTLMAVGAIWGGDVIEPELMRAAKRGYESVRGLTEQEIVWLPQAIMYASESWINWFRANGHERYARRHQGRYASFVEIFGDDLAL